MLPYLIIDLQDDRNEWYTDLDGVKDFFSNIWEEDEEMVEEINSADITIERLQEIAVGVEYFIEYEE